MTPFFLFHIDHDENDIFLYCHSETGEKRVITISDFRHYFYAQNSSALCAQVLNKSLAPKPNVKRRKNDDEDYCTETYVREIEPVTVEPIYHYKPNYTRKLGDFVKVVLEKPSYMAIVAKAVTNFGLRVYEEKKISHVYRFLIEVGVNVGQWFTYDGTGWRGVRLVNRTDLPGSLTAFTYDIECKGLNGEFPQANRDPVIQIGCLVSRKDEQAPREFLLTWRETAPIDGVDVRVAADERGMFTLFKDLVLQEDPDFIVTFNGNQFDNPYLIHRAEHMGWYEFLNLGRRSNVPATVHIENMDSKAHGGRKQYIALVCGRVLLDVNEEIRRRFKDMRTYSLNACSARWLGDSKSDLHHSQISAHWDGSVAQRTRLARYCVQDVRLTYRLYEVLKFDLSVISISRVSVLDMHNILTKGQQLKSTVMICKYAKQHGYICPFANKDNYFEDKYEGALVLNVEPRLITDYIMCLDFNSLYPSLIISHNLCYTTWITTEVARTLPSDDYITTPTGDCFVKAHVRRGLLPMLMSELLASRAWAKGEMKKAPTDAIRAVFDKLQDVMKVENNSKYGYTGVGKGHLPCLAISRSTTALGKQALRTVITWVETNMPEKEVVYGDTDSVFVRCPGLSREEAWECMHATAKRITQEKFAHLPPMCLGAEKIMETTIFVCPKKYGTLKYQDSLDKPVFYYRGLEVVRRDWCPLVCRTMKACFELILGERKYDEAYEIARKAIEDLYAERVEMQDLLLGAGLSKPVEQYVNAAKHTRLVEKMMERDEKTAPRVGDRVCYVMVSGSDSKQVREWSEDPLYVLEHNLQINVDFYVNNQMRGPLERMFGPVYKKNPDKINFLFTGPHARRRIVHTPKPSTAHGRGTLLAHVVRKSTPCAICTAPTPNPMFCNECSADTDKIAAHRAKQQAEIVDMEDLVAQSDATCRHCQQIGPDEPIHCMARDCPNLYTRHHRMKKLETMNSKIV